MGKETTLATTIIRERLSSLGISLAPVAAADKTAPDVMILVRRAADSSKTDVIRVLAHSTILKKECDYFREWFIEYDIRMAKEQQHKGIVKEMVRQVMNNVEEEAALTNAITTMVHGVIRNVIERQRKEQEEEEGIESTTQELQHEDSASPTPAENKIETVPKSRQRDEEDKAAPNYILMEQLEWSKPVLEVILEWLYTRCCHIDISQLSSVYEAAKKMVFPSLLGAIRDYNNPEYLRYALDGDEDRQSLLKLCLKAPCDELTSLRMLCESINRSPLSTCFSVVLEAASIAYRTPHLIPEGLYTLSEHPVCSLKDSQSMEPLKPYITLYRETGVYQRRRVISSYQSAQGAPKMKKASWRIIDLGNNPVRCCYRLFRFAADTSFNSARSAGMLVKPVVKESFSLRMVTGSMVSSIIKGALSKAIRSKKLKITEERGSGYYIRGPSYCFSLLLQGDPSMILVGAKAIPHEMVGRAAFRIRNPSERTFTRFLPAMRSFGVDFEANTLYMIKPLSSIIKILEFVVGVSREAYTPLEFERHVVEIVEPTDPF